MGLARYFVVRHHDQWLVTLEGHTMTSHRSQPQAINSAIVMADLMGAMHHDADVMVEDQTGGPLRLVWTFGDASAAPVPIPPLQVIPGHSHVKRIQQPADTGAMS